MPERALEPYPSPTWPQLASGSTALILWFVTVMMIVAAFLGFVFAALR